MIISSLAITIFLMIALLAAVTTTVQVNRKHTLSKNFEWVIANPPFARQYDEPPLWPLYISALLIIIGTLYGSITGSELTPVVVKNIGIVIALVVLVPFYYFIEKNIGKKIPIRKERTATFEKRSIYQYVSRTQLWLAHGCVLLVLCVNIIMFIAGNISKPMCIVNLINMFFVYGIQYGSMIWAIKENTPHYKDTSIISEERLSENYRKFSINLIRIMIMCASGLLLTSSVFLGFGYILAESPFTETIYRTLGETKALTPVMSVLHLDMIVSIFIIPLLLYIARCKAIRDIVTISVIKK